MENENLDSGTYGESIIVKFITTMKQIKLFREAVESTMNYRDIPMTENTIIKTIDKK